VGTEDSDALGRSMARGRVRPAAEVEAMGGHGGTIVVVGAARHLSRQGQRVGNTAERGTCGGEVRDWVRSCGGGECSVGDAERMIGYRRSRLMDGRTVEQGETDYLYSLNM
jgi:hypothetical protein